MSQRRRLLRWNVLQQQSMRKVCHFASYHKVYDELHYSGGYVDHTMPTLTPTTVLTSKFSQRVTSSKLLTFSSDDAVRQNVCGMVVGIWGEY